MTEEHPSFNCNNTLDIIEGELTQLTTDITTNIQYIKYRITKLREKLNKHFEEEFISNSEIELDGIKIPDKNIDGILIKRTIIFGNMSWLDTFPLDAFCEIPRIRGGDGSYLKDYASLSLELRYTEKDELGESIKKSIIKEFDYGDDVDKALKNYYKRCK